MELAQQKKSNHTSVSRNKAPDYPGMYDKVPPQAVELEEAILGAILLERGAMDIALGILVPECFYLESNQGIFKAMRSMSKRNIPIDMLTMVQELKATGEIDKAGGPYGITKLTNNVVSAANIEMHCRIVLQKFMARELIRIGGEMITAAYQDTTDVFELLNQSEQGIFGLTLNFIGKEYKTLPDILVNVARRIEELRIADESITGIPTGFPQLDKVTHGWQPTDLIILAARPSVGKTTFALNLARNAAMHPNKPVGVGFFSLEMSEDQLSTRILSMQSGLWLESLHTGRLDDHQMEILYNKGLAPLSRCPIVIDDTAGLNMFELRSKVRKMISKNKVGLIIIDYLQLMSGDTNRNTNREQEISKISRELKKLAKDTKIPIIALSQLSREVEKRGKGFKSPQLSDLRESGAIEQDADMVMFLYRPPEDEVAEDADLQNKAMVKIAKHRNGKLIEVAFEVHNEIQKWTEHGAINNSPRYKSVSQTNIDTANLKFPYKDNDNDDEELPF